MEKEKEKALVVEAQSLVEQLESMLVTDAASMLALALRHTSNGRTINKLVNVLIESNALDSQLGTDHKKKMI
ncbi:hypothetical protein [uncultured Dubosiella sp.]|uniref:hypothetical protein n=1 Tax=uncultured Dubosiella sp. TaxID=1937011 RepID=UPI0025B3E90E|nr:hypothetical protein [uncultured Dubosiella sp.]